MRRVLSRILIQLFACSPDVGGIIVCLTSSVRLGGITFSAGFLSAGGELSGKRNINLLLHSLALETGTAKIVRLLVRL